MLMLITFVSFAIFLVLLTSRRALACTTVIVGRRASATGRVLVGHNEDEPGRFSMQTHLVESRHHGGGNVMRFETSCAAVPLPEFQPRLFWSEARTLKGASSSDLYLNGNGVFICTNNCSKSREDADGESGKFDLKLRDGGVIYGIRYIVAESAKSARDAVDIAIKLIDQFGYAASGRSYHFIDSHEAWVLQVVHGRHYAVKRIPDDEVYVIPNHYTIHEPDPDTPGLQALMDYAQARGWWDGREKFDFARVYQAPESRGHVRNMHRHVRALEILLEQDLSDLLDKPGELPFSVKPAHPVTIESIKKILRTHYEGTSSYVPKSESENENGTPHFAMETRPICDSSTLESTIVELHHDADLNILRKALGQPCVSVYMPWYFGITTVPDGYETIDSKSALATHFTAPAEHFDWQDTIGFKINLLHGAVDLLYGHNKNAQVDLVRSRVAAIEANIERELKMLDSQIQLRLHTDPDVSRAMMQGAVNSWAVSVRMGVQSLIEKLGIFEAAPKGELKLRARVKDKAKDASFVVQVSDTKALMQLDDFDLNKLDLSRCLCGPRYVDISKWSRLSQFQNNENENEDEGLKLTFQGGEWLNDPDLTPCLTDLMILLVNSQGERRVGTVRIQVQVNKL